jgi:drug/metabolite transporter (DMT)-like permease
MTLASYLGTQPTFGVGVAQEIRTCLYGSMSTVAIALVLSSAFLHALWNALLKRHPDAPSAGVVALLFSAIFSVAPLPFEAGPHFPTWFGLGLAVGAGVFEAGYIYTLTRALQSAPLSVVYPLSRGGALAFVWPVSVLFLGEPFYWWALIGLFLLWLGLCFSSSRNIKTPISKRGVWLAVICALCIAGYNLCYKSALRDGSTPIALCAVSLSLSTPVSILLLGKERLASLWSTARARFGYLLLIGFVSALSFLLFVIALKGYDAGAALTLRSLSIVFAQFLALLLGERPSRKQWMGAFLVTAGAILVNTRK